VGLKQPTVAGRRRLADNRTQIEVLEVIVVAYEMRVVNDGEVIIRANHEPIYTLVPCGGSLKGVIDRAEDLGRATSRKIVRERGERASATGVCEVFDIPAHALLA
jgi:hypothetical protein